MVDLTPRRKKCFHKEAVLELGIERWKLHRRREKEGEKRRIGRKEIVAIQ